MKWQNMNIVEKNDYKSHIYTCGESTRGYGEYIPIGDFGSIPEFLMTKVRVKRYKCNCVKEITDRKIFTGD